MQALTILKKFFSVDMVIYAAIVIVAATALLRCTLPLSRIAAQTAPRGADHRHRKQAEQRKKVVERYALPRRFPFRDMGGFFAERRNARRARAKPAT